MVSAMKRSKAGKEGMLSWERVVRELLWEMFTVEET